MAATENIRSPFGQGGEVLLPTNHRPASLPGNFGDSRRDFLVAKQPVPYQARTLIRGRIRFSFG